MLAGMALLDRAGGSFAAVVSLPFLISLLSVGILALSLKYGETVWILFPMLVLGSFLLSSRYAAGKVMTEPSTAHTGLPNHSLERTQPQRENRMK